MGAHWQRSWLNSRSNPLIFVTDVLGVTPEPWQAEALEAVGKHDRVSIRSGHGVGKTTLQAWLVLCSCLPTRTAKYPWLRTPRISSATPSGLRSPSGTGNCRMHLRP